MAATVQLDNFCGRKNLKSEINKILHIPHDMEMLSDFKVLLKFKIAAMD